MLGGNMLKFSYLKKSVELNLGETKYIKHYKDTQLRLLCMSLLVEETPTGSYGKWFTDEAYIRKVKGIASQQTDTHSMKVMWFLIEILAK